MARGKERRTGSAAALRLDYATVHQHDFEGGNPLCSHRSVTDCKRGEESRRKRRRKSRKRKEEETQAQPSSARKVEEAKEASAPAFVPLPPTPTIPPNSDPGAGSTGKKSLIPFSAR